MGVRCCWPSIAIINLQRVPSCAHVASGSKGTFVEVLTRSLSTLEAHSCLVGRREDRGVAGGEVVQPEFNFKKDIWFS